MNRLVGSGYRTAIAAAFEMLPRWIADELEGTQFLCGVDPIYAGLHHFEDTGDGRSYRDTAHVVYGFHCKHRPADDRATTIVMPVVEQPWVVVHELGHVLHDRLDFPDAPDPVTWYAATDVYEAFAEGFTMAHVPGYALQDFSLERLAAYRERHPHLAPYFCGAGFP